MSQLASDFGNTWHQLGWQPLTCATHRPKIFYPNWKPCEEVAEGENYNEEAAAYYGEDNYNEYVDYDPDDHTGVKALRTFFHEADSYFDAGQFAVAAEACQLPPAEAGGM
jgi:hypothetical protein